MRQWIARRRQMWVLAAVVTAAVAVQAQENGPAASSAKAKEVASLMAAKKLDTFAARDPEKAGKYVAVLLVPNVQLLLVSAAYTRDNDIEYSLYHKLYQNAYQDLRSGVFGAERFFVDDAMADGLVAVPGKKIVLHDAITIEKAKQIFDGVFDPKGKDSKKPAQDAYMKAFSDADARYARLLDVLIAQLKGSAAVDASATMR